MKESLENIDDLIGKYLAKEASAAEVQAVEEWIAENDLNRSYFSQVQLIFDKAAAVREVQQFNTDAAWEKVKSNLKNGKQVHITPARSLHSEMFWYRVAAAVIIVVGVGFFLLRGDLSEDNSFRVLAENKAVADTLPNGSDVFLNKNTKLDYAYDKTTKTHEVKLKGEAYFNVKNSKREQFIINAGDVFIKDIGTSFNVKAYPNSDEVEVLVEEGEIVFYTADNPGIHLKESGKAVYNRTTRAFKVEQPEPNITAYKTKFFVFTATNLQTMAAQLNEVYDKKLIIPDHLRSCTITVSFRDENLEEIAAVVAETLGLTYTEQADSINFDGKGCE